MRGTSSMHSARDLRTRRRQQTSAKDYHRGCQGKQRFSSKNTALAIRQGLMNASQSLDEYYEAEFLDAYKCEGHWHMGHDSGWKEGWIPQWV